MQLSTQPRRNRRRNTRTNIPRVVNIGLAFPPQLRAQHIYSDQFILTGSLGVMANYRFRAAGLFDPNATASGHQPGYYDNLTAIYDHWVVVSSKIDITILPPTTASTPAAVGVALNDDLTTGPTSFIAYSEAPQTRMTYFTPDAGIPAKLSQSYVLNKLWPLESSSAFWGSATADPVEETIYNVFLQAVDQTTTAAAFLVAKITYDVIWFERKDPVVS